MSVESAADRHRKRIVEHTISGFGTAESAVTFGNTAERVIKDAIGDQKFRQYIGAQNTGLAITEGWTGPTVLRTTFLELKDDGMAAFICDEMKRVAKVHNEVHKTSISITSETVRGKPQPQYIG